MFGEEIETVVHDHCRARKRRVKAMGIGASDGKMGATLRLQQ